MSKADEMFKKLEYKISFEDSHYIRYRFVGVFADTEIQFDLKEETIFIESSLGESQEISMQELQAIYEKVKELGRLDD